MRFALGQLIRGGPATGFSGFNRLGQLFAFFGDFGGAFHRVAQFLLGLLTPFGQFTDPLARSLQTVAPTAQFLDDLLAAAGAGIALAAQFIMGGPFRHHGHARGLNRHAHVLNPRAGPFEVIEILNRLTRLGQTFAGQHRLILMTLDGQIRALQLACRDGFLGLGAGQGAARIGHQTIRIAPRLTGQTVGLGQIGKTLFQHLMRLGGPLGACIRLLQILLQLAQTVQLLQAQGCGGRRVLGPRAIPVPAPQIPVQRDQPLTRFQLGLQGIAIGGGHDTDLVHATVHQHRAGHVIGQRFCPCGQVIGFVVTRQIDPTGRLGAIDLGRAQIIAQRRAQRLFIPRMDVQIVQNLTVLNRVTFNQAGKRARLGA